MRRSISVLALFALVAMIAAACGGDDSAGGGGSTNLTLVAYSTPQEAYQEIIPEFQKTAGGKGVSFDQSYGASGDQERAVEGGLAADVVALSLEPDVDKLVKAGLVDKTWNKDRYRGFVTDSIVVFAVRKGNPENIRSWADLVKPGVEVITPNPFTSGGARWNIMAAYGAQLKQGASPAEALDYVRRLLKNTPVQDKSARESLQTFAAGKGDVLLAYENEAITAQQKGQELDFVRPAETILIENPVAVTGKTKHPAQARKFIDFLRSDAAQRIFASKGYRPVVKRLVDARRFPSPRNLFTIDDLGGWSKVSAEFFDPEKGKIAAVERDLGVPTEK